MSDPTIAYKWPLKVSVQQGKKYFWCACGLSKNQPFCDGSHTLLIHQAMSGFAVANILTTNLFVMAPIKKFNTHIVKYFNHEKPCQ